MHRLIATVLLFSSVAYAQIENLIQFHGQNAETISIDKQITVTRSVTQEVPDTCTRDIPYENYECNDVTRYRQECSWVPASEECRNVDEQECHPVTRTREECSNGPARRVCHQNPPRQVCTTRPSHQECTTIPSRQVCTERPSRQVCHARPNGQGQVCQTVGGGQSCQTVGGGQSCRTVGGGQDCRNVDGGQSCHDEPGPRVCRNVSYTDQECRTVSRRRCETIPGHNACRDIPYSEQVCGNVTHYRQESYACTRTETHDVEMPKQLTGVIQVQFNTNGLVEEFPLSVLLLPSADYRSMVSKSALQKEPSILVSVVNNKIDVQENDTQIVVNGVISYELVDPKMVSPSFPLKLTPKINKETQILSLLVEGSMSAMGDIEIALTAKPFIGRRYNVASLKAEYPSERVNIVENKIEINLKDLLKHDLKKKMDLKVKLAAKIGIQGEILNTKVPLAEKSYDLKIRE